jgi:hypothetical protein
MSKRAPRKSAAKKKAPARKRAPRKTAAPKSKWQQEEQAVADVEQTRETMRGVARKALGVTGEVDAPPLRDGITRSGVGWYPLLALGALVIVDEFQSYALFVLGPEVTDGLGMSRGALAFAVAVKTLVLSVAALPIAALAQR